MLGVITIAAGDKRYIDMAKNLALSLIYTNPNLKRAVITDSAPEVFDGLYDILVPYNNQYGKGLSQKLYLDKYSPFEETFFIDSDCLAFDSLQPTIDLCQEHKFVVFGGQISTGEWYMEVPDVLQRFQLTSIPLFNGGTYYFSDRQLAKKIYDKARELYADYSTIGFKELRGAINEEPLLSVSMALNGIAAVDDNGIGMRTPIGIIGSLNVDVLNKICKFNKEGLMVKPAILHFSGAHALSFHYRREVAKLKLQRVLPFVNTMVLSIIVELAYNIPYSALVFAKRVIKRIIRKEKFDFSNALPVFSNQ